MRFIRGRDFKAGQAWGSELIANMNGITTKIHWTDKPYRWHINDGEEVFVVLAGSVNMHYKKEGQQHTHLMSSGDVFFASMGTEHLAEPIGEARILVVEHEGSV
jgi:mannose-6-phosphate isomerase-like protein (cupin superfamily)